VKCHVAGNQSFRRQVTLKHEQTAYSGALENMTAAQLEKK
jgi:hypothetical protein